MGLFTWLPVCYLLVFFGWVIWCCFGYLSSSVCACFVRRFEFEFCVLLGVCFGLFGWFSVWFLWFVLLFAYLPIYFDACGYCDWLHFVVYVWFVLLLGLGWVCMGLVWCLLLAFLGVVWMGFGWLLVCAYWLSFICCL